MADIQIISGAVHRDAGPITTLLPVTDRGRDWLASEMGMDIDCTTTTGCAIIETDQVDLVIGCIEQANLSWESL